MTIHTELQANGRFRAWRGDLAIGYGATRAEAIAAIGRPRLPETVRQLARDRQPFVP